MAENESFNVYKRKLDEQFEEVKSHLIALIHKYGFCFANGEGKEVADRLRIRLNKLSSYLSSKDQPRWLTSFRSAVDTFVGEPSHQRSNELIWKLIYEYENVEPIDLEGVAKPLLDFDALYEHCRDAGRLQELFDEMMRIVRQMIDSGDIDSIATLDALKQMLQLLKANRDGSFVAVKQTVDILHYLKNLAFVVIEKLPVVAELREAFDRTLEEADREMKKVEEDIRVEMMKAVTESLPRLKAAANGEGGASIVIVPPKALPAPTPS